MGNSVGEMRLEGGFFGWFLGWLVDWGLGIGIVFRYVEVGGDSRLE